MIQKFKDWYANWKRDREYQKEKKKFMKSEEPWVVIKSDKIDPQKGIQLDMDWNDAFVKHLRANGVKGIKDEDVVAYWVTMIHSQLINNKED